MGSHHPCRAIRAVIVAPLKMSTVQEDLEDGRERRYVRRDQKMSKLVYRAQLVRSLFGKGVALFFMHIMKVNAGVAQRVLRSQKSRLRR